MLDRGIEKAIKWCTFNPIFKGVKPPMTQTPGRAQYYYPETLHLIPDNILYKVRMPLKIAGMEDSKEYEDVVKEKTIDYLKSKFSHNLFDPEKGFHLNLTIGDIRHLSRASEAKFQKAESGDLQTIVDSERELREKIESLIVSIEDTLDDVEDKVNLYAKQTAKLLASGNIPSNHTLTDLIPGYGRDFFTIAVEDISNALGEGSNKELAELIANRLHAVAHARHTIAHIRLDLINCWNEHRENHVYDRINYEAASKTHDEALSILESIPASWQGKTTTFGETLVNISTKQLPDYLKSTAEFEKANANKEAFFSDFTHDDVYDQTPDKIKEDLLVYLSSAIIVKKHRHRYQAEQYDRYLTFMKWLPISEDMTLKQFSVNYAEFLRREVEMSYDFTCPKIQANYDDYGERNTNPINATVFYYFFNANRTRRKLAQAILSAARYPNEKIRRAYLRFFQNA